MVRPSPIYHVDGHTVIGQVAFIDSPQPVTIEIGGLQITSISEAADPGEWIALPPLINEHVHANRAFTLGATRPETFEHAVMLTLEMFSDFSSDQYTRQSRLLFETANRHGTTGQRTHADLDKDTRLRAVEGTLDARRDVQDRMDIDIVAYASTRADPADFSTESMLRDAVAMGCTYLGAIPVFYTTPRRSIDKIFELALDLDVPIDVHKDKPLVTGNAWSEYLADAAIANDYYGRVCLSHGCALTTLTRDTQRRVIDKLVEAQIEVIALPLTNLYLQGRGNGTPLRRGVTAVHELLDAGVPVRFGSDNACDVFFPFGDADLLDTAYLAMLATQLEDPVNLIQGICSGKTRLHVEDAADLVLIKGTNIDDILRRRPAERIVVRQGDVRAPQTE